MKKTKKAYSILIALLIVGFLFILSAGVFQMLLREMNDNHNRADYLKAYYGAESGIEWALLDIKDNTYGYIDTIELNKDDNRSRVLAKFSFDKGAFNGKRDVLVSYDIDTRTQNYSGSLDPGEHLMLPLYYRDKAGWYDTKDISLSINSYNQSIIWNIVGEDFGLSGSGNFDNRTDAYYKGYNDDGTLFFKKNKIIEEFLSESNKNYLILLNTNPDEQIQYTIKSNGDNFFTKPLGDIYASAMVGETRQNIRLSLDNTAFLSILKYSIFSP